MGNGLTYSRYMSEYSRHIDLVVRYMEYSRNMSEYPTSTDSRCMPVCAFKVYTCKSVLNTCLYILLQLIFCPEWEGTYLYILLRLSTYDVQLLCSCLRPEGPPATCWPTCSLRAAHSKAAHSLQQQDTLGQEQISVLLCRQLQGSPKAASSSAVAEPLAALAAPASGSELDSYVVWATHLRLNVVARGRASEIDRLYPPSWGCLDRQEQRLFRYGRECAVMTLKSLHKLKQLYFSHSAFKRSTIIEEHQIEVVLQGKN